MHFNKVCDADDWDDPQVKRIMVDHLRLPADIDNAKERKHWEWAMGMLALKEYGFLRGECVGLGLGCGHERLMYALTGHARMVVATDLYGQTAFEREEADAGILRDPAKYSPFPYEKSRLLVRTMDATRIDFADGQFDFLFSFSSLEHFGRNGDIVRSMQEAYRVLRPGGAYVLSLDYLFHTPSRHVPRDYRLGKTGELFTREDVQQLVLEPADFKLRQEIQFEVPEEKLCNVYDTMAKKSSTGETYPHIHLKFLGYMFSSLLLVLFKE